MMSQPKLCNPHGLPTAQNQVGLLLRNGRFVRSGTVVNVLGVADGDVVPLGAED